MEFEDLQAKWTEIQQTKVTIGYIHIYLPTKRIGFLPYSSPLGYLSIYICQSVCLSDGLSIRQSVYLTVCLSDSLSI
jgi:hypothetical protein